MAEIQEIPLDENNTIEKEILENNINPEENDEIDPEIENDENIPPKRSRGRPPGAKNKETKPRPDKAKPKPKPKPKIKPKPQPIYNEYEDEEYSDEEPAPRQNKARVSAKHPGAAALDRQALASEVLGLLQMQHASKTQARRSHYATWFQQM